jgi:glycosyltransferase involved in cell wall biosynthesis
LPEFCREIRVVIHKPQFISSAAGFFLHGKPYNALRYASTLFRDELSELLGRKDFDIVQIEFPMMWQYTDLLKGLPVVLDMHNIENHLIAQMKEKGGSIVKHFLYGLEEQRLRKIEEDAWRACDLCVAVSDRERDIIAEHLAEAEKVLTIPNGVDLERFTYYREKKGENRLLFIGSMDYIPTIDSTDYLLQEIVPLITSQMKGVTIDIVGRRLGRLRDRVRSDDIVLHENVPDILPFLRGADVLIDPLRLGAGTRLKILEAMASGTPVVTTRKGCEGLMVRDREHLIIADSPGEFARAVVTLLTDGPRAGRLAASARSLVEDRYSWKKSVETLAEAMRQLV